jgi:hypothetical protein
VTIAFLHTADAHVRTFTDLVEALAPGTPTVHVVDATLLADARTRGGVDAELADRLAARLAEAAAGAAVVVCTCSTLAGPAEDLGPVAGVPVLRIDRPMAERAVALGPRIAAIAAVSSTLGPTVELLEGCAGAAGTPIEITTVLVEDAWPAFEAGDTATYEARIAAAVDRIAPDVDVVVLAQASMAGAGALVTTRVPVLASPGPAVEAALGSLGPT